MRYGLHLHLEPETEPPPRASGGPRHIPIEPDGSVSELTQSESELVSDGSKLWDVGQVLDLSMTGGTAAIRRRVREIAEQWTQFANLRFNWTDQALGAHIRITFDTDDTSWSYVGRDSIGFFSLLTPSLNLAVDASSTNDEVRRAVLHEFGHAIGMKHEHQSPDAGIQWDRERVYEDAAAWWNCDRACVDHNIFQQLSSTSINHSDFDPDSVMIYPIDESWTLDDFSVPWNTNLSALDQEWARRWYPQPYATTGQLRPEDSDAVDFVIRPGAVVGDFLAFELRQQRPLTWWKEVSIPSGDSYVRLEVVNETTTARVEIPAADLDTSRPIRFAKAKFLGVHTGLSYAWDVLPHLAAGDEVTLTWVRD